MYEDDRNARQLRLMLARLDEFERGRCSLERLVADLEGLLNAVENAPPAWRDDFRQISNDFEVSFAMARYRQSIGEMASDDASILRQSVTELRDLVMHRMKAQ